jgi:hypothetical protein
MAFMAPVTSLVAVGFKSVGVASGALSLRARSSLVVFMTTVLSFGVWF